MKGIGPVTWPLRAEYRPNGALRTRGQKYLEFCCWWPPELTLAGGITREAGATGRTAGRESCVPPAEARPPLCRVGLGVWTKPASLRTQFWGAPDGSGASPMQSHAVRRGTSASVGWVGGWPIPARHGAWPMMQPALPLLGNASSFLCPARPSHTCAGPARP